MTTSATQKMRTFISKLKGFDRLVQQAKILSAENGSCSAVLKVQEEHTNPMGGLHGGFSATLVDSISSIALYTHKNGERISVSVDMSLSYIRGAKVGEEILIEAKTLKTGKSLAFLDVEIKNKATGDLLVKGAHTKYLLE